MTTRRKFLTTGALGGAAALAAPSVGRAQAPIKWRMQTYAGAALGEHVVKPAVDAFNEIAQGQMEIELYYSDQLVPTAELFQAMQSGTIDCVQSDDDSMASPTEVTVFGGYFPMALRYSLDVPALFNKYGLKQIWEEEYAAVGVKHISAGSWDPCNFSTKKPINSLEDLKGLRIFTFPTAGRFLAQFGVVPVTLPWEDVEVALQTGELDGLAWSGITEVYTVGWANVTDYFLTNNISGAWIGHFFANMDRWNAVPPHLQKLLETCFEQSHYYRQHWYWAGEADLRINGGKLKLTTIPDTEWQTVQDAAVKFWDEVATESETKAKVVEIIKKYNETMVQAGPPYRY
ncbi:TRAP-type mannitol/chloroaromatic compound transport system substrate-binding protein [Gemmobacter caeni]|uniref:TRAP-type mannitol/chloroaromatic compound transport system substrate-binding protein n=1 Tax=Gemmobacter caeni TaxID=589035 RepID=A0A2T6ASL5_9RHOB|nr:TRAP transporter substrate-binding protein [Gemmobacter caeni]PTX46822.1 TRAP-type mannitol/chloroaromatic compound transport system substrate-binding protein [Gemmobacter caeni]TWI95704.1 TRAP-type mannitol/chloroaromatic compound transport system substrate-binding protein [Gemmobacter caeni]